MARQQQQQQQQQQPPPFKYQVPLAEQYVTVQIQKKLQ
jgi:hypothetical protein